MSATGDDSQARLLAFQEQLKQILSEFSQLEFGLTMIAIPGGTFTIGSPPSEKGRYDREGPQHEVTVQPFSMGRYPVTQAQWRFVANLEQVNRELEPDPSQFKGDNRPVEKVSWYEAVEFCDRLSAIPDETIGFQPKPSGNTPAEQGQKPPSTSVKPFPQNSLTITAKHPLPMALQVKIVARRPL